MQRFKKIVLALIILIAILLILRAVLSIFSPDSKGSLLEGIVNILGFYISPLLLVYWVFFLPIYPKQWLLLPLGWYLLVLSGLVGVSYDNPVSGTGAAVFSFVGGALLMFVIYPLLVLRIIIKMITERKESASNPASLSPSEHKPH